MPAFAKDKSRIKMLVYIPQADGSDVPVTRYSYISKNGNSDSKIIADMKRRILEKQLGNVYRTAIFYNNKTGDKIHQITNSIMSQNLAFDVKESRVKMLVYVPDITTNRDVVYTRYSPLIVNEKSLHEIIKYMEVVFLKGLYLNKFRTAIFYENIPEKKGKEINKIYGNAYNTFLKTNS